MSMLRVVVARALRPAVRGRMQASVRCYSTAHGDDALPPAEFDAKWKAYFEDPSLTSRDVRRGLNDVFAHDLIPATPILEAALRATRRVNDFPTSVRLFEGIKDKSPDDATYKHVVNELQGVIAELHLTTPDELKL